MSGTSNVGQASVNEDEGKRANRFHEGKENSHKALDSSQ